MHVLHINTNYMGTQLHQTMLEHFGASIENDVFVPTFKGKEKVVIPNSNVIISECFRKWDRLFFGYKQRKILDAIERLYCIERYNLLHAHTLFTDGNCARTLKEKYNIPYIVAIRNTDVNVFFSKLFWLRSLGVKIMQEAAAIVFLSPSYMSMVYDQYIPRKQWGAMRKKTYIIPNGIDDFWLNNIYWKKDMNFDLEYKKTKEIHLLYVGEISKNKNIELTLKAINILKSQNIKVEFTVVGKIKDENVYKNLAKCSNTHYIEPKRKEELIEYYRKNDVFVMPSHTETFGLVYAEAMSQGLPIIYTRRQGFDGQFQDGEVGRATSDSNPYELAKQILYIAEHYKCIAQNALLLCQKFNWASIVKKYEDIYRSIVNRV